MTRRSASLRIEPSAGAGIVTDWTTEPIVITEYDPAWPHRAADYRAELDGILGPWLVNPIEHTGSTAVQGLAAKNVIDLMAMVRDRAAVAAITAAELRDHSWRQVPPALDGRPWRDFFVKVSLNNQQRLAHLRLMAVGEPRWKAHLMFRDLLRQDGLLRAEYASLKRAVARNSGPDRDEYSRNKAAFVERVVSTIETSVHRDPV